MGLLDEPGLDRLLDTGLRKVPRAQADVRTYVDGWLPIMGGEPVGRLTWVYDGEKFIDGVYEVACAGVQGEPVRGRRLSALPRRGRPAGARSGRPIAGRSRRACPSCDDEQLRYIAFVPARVIVRRQARRQGAQRDRAARGRLSRLSRRLPRLRHRRRARRRVPAVRGAGAAARPAGLTPQSYGLGASFSLRVLALVVTRSASSIECDLRMSARRFAISASRP